MTPVSFASAPWDNRLVVIILRGAMDGLDVVQPTGDADFHRLRPGAADASLPLDGFYSLHQRLSPLLPLWRAGELAFAQAVSTPYRDSRSHFDGQDILEAGVSSRAQVWQVGDGWLNRLLQSRPGVEMETGFAVGGDYQRIFAGDAQVANWAPRTQLTLGAAAENLLAATYEHDPLFHNAMADAVTLARTVGNGDPAGGRPEIRLARFAAGRLRDSTLIASFSLNGWDTHKNQAQRMRQLLPSLADVILTLKHELGPVWSKTAVLAITDFGRTARINGSRGTDHGTGGAMLMAGGAIRGGKVYGTWPGLSDDDLYDQRDLMPTRDVRAYAGWAMRSLFAIERGAIEDSIFPGLELGEDVRIIS